MIAATIPTGAKRLKVVELYCGPGGGKSTTAAKLFYLCKLLRAEHGKRMAAVELVTEYAKEAVYRKSSAVEVQALVFGEQYMRLHVLQGQVDIAISDSPLHLSAQYADPELYPADAWQQVIEAHYKRLDVLSVFLHRVKPYETYGRREDEGAARQIDRELYCRFGQIRQVTRGSARFESDGDEHAADRILQHMQDIGWINIAKNAGNVT